MASALLLLFAGLYHGRVKSFTGPGGWGLTLEDVKSGGDEFAASLKKVQETMLKTDKSLAEAIRRLTKRVDEFDRGGDDAG